MLFYFKGDSRGLLLLIFYGCVFFTPKMKAQEVFENKYIFSPIDYRLELKCTDLNSKKDSIDFSKTMQLEFYEKEFIQKEHSYLRDKEVGLNPIKTEELFPEMFYEMENFVPNVYSKTNLVRYTGGGYIEVMLPSEHILNVGDTVLIFDKNKVGTKLNVEKISSKNGFFIKDRLPKSESYFVFGTLVKDYKQLHYQELIVLNLRVSQMLNEKIEMLNKKNEKLDLENKKLQIKIKDIETKKKKL